MLHGRDCGFDHHDRADIERAQTDILATVSTGPTTRSALQTAIDRPWTDLHEASLRMLVRDARIDIDRSGGDDTLRLVAPDDIADRIEPTDEPLRTIYEHGSVAGAHDNSVFAMVAYYASKGLTWEDTRRQVLNWLEESGTWARGGFEEPTPEALVDDKRHVYEEQYGWLEKAKAAKRVIDNSHLVDA